MTACTRAALRTGRAVPGVRRGREAFEVLIANCKIEVLIANCKFKISEDSKILDLVAALIKKSF